MGDPGWLSSPLSELRAHYTVVVVGSGYGAAIAASRLARAGQSVCVLERGRELHPGDFPRSTETAATHVQLEGEHEVGDRRNLYDFHVSEDMTVFSGCGLGGTSLINANVALRPEDWVLDDERWPAALRDDRAGLDRGYAAATTMLAPTPYPNDFPPLAKVAALESSAGSATWYRTPITVTFRAGPNAAGVHQEACTGCGDCTTGCNYGAKNTLLMNYLPDAVRHGAAVFTEVEVERVERRDGRWAVVYRTLGVRDPFHGPAPVVTADVVMLGAGTLGSTGVLLRSREHGLPLSEQLGHRFTGNGDVLGFNYGTGHDIDGVGAGPEPPSTTHPAGPCITSVIDERGDGAGADGIVIEDAVIPGAIGELVPLQLASQALPDWLRRRVHRGGLASLVASLLTRGRRGALRQTQTFLVMGHDDDEGRLVLDGDRVRIEWRGAGTTPYYERVNERLTALSAASGGRYLHSPVWSKALRHELITVHPLGGCPMADTAEAGVVDDRGRVFAGPAGTAVHDGLYVCDGAIVPRPLGVNPLLTISALAERIVALAAGDRGWTVDEAVDAPADETSPRPTRAGLRFTEQMAGWFAPGDQGLADAGVSDVDTFRQAARDGETAESPMRFVLTLTSDDLEALTAALDTPMRAAGTVEAPALDSGPLTVDGGEFQLFAADDPDPAIRHMWYRLPLVAADGRRFFFEGFKTVAPGVVTGAWAATTTLYVTVHRDAADGPVAGRGVLRIAPADFAKQMRTMTVTGPVSERRRLELLAAFQESFAGLLVHEYGTAIRRSSRLNRARAAPSAPPIESPTAGGPPLPVPRRRRPAPDALPGRPPRAGGHLARPGRQPAHLLDRPHRDERRRVPRGARLRRVDPGVAGLHPAAHLLRVLHGRRRRLCGPSRGGAHDPRADRPDRPALGDALRRVDHDHDVDARRDDHAGVHRVLRGGGPPDRPRDHEAEGQAQCRRAPPGGARAAALHRQLQP